MSAPYLVAWENGAKKAEFRIQKNGADICLLRF